MSCRFSIAGNHRHFSKSDAKRLLSSGMYRLEGKRLVPLSPTERLTVLRSRTIYSPGTLPPVDLPGLKFVIAQKDTFKLWKSGL